MPAVYLLTHLLLLVYGEATGADVDE